MAALLPDANPNDPHAGHGTQRRKGEGTTIPDINTILQMLMQLNGLIMLKLVSSQQANLIQRNLRAVLDLHLKRAREDWLGMPHEGLLELCRKDPSLVNLLDPFLTDEQVARLMKSVTDDPNEEA